MSAPSKTTRKYNITLKAPPMLVCKNMALAGYLKANTALSFVSCCVLASQYTPPCAVFSALQCNSIIPDIVE